MVELLLLAIAVAYLFVVFVVTFFGIFMFAMGLWYGHYYLDRTEVTGTRSWPAFRDFWLWRFIRDHYFRHSTLYVDPDGALSSQCDWIDDKPQYLFAASPHGYHPMGVDCAFGVGTPGPLGKVRIAVHSYVFKCPGLRSFALWFGACDIEKTHLNETLDLGHSVVILPGGSRGMIVAATALCLEDELAHDRERMGFLRVAFAHKLPLVPVFNANESSVFCLGTWKRLAHQCQTWTQWPVGVFFLGPWPVKLATVIGRPVDTSSFESLEELREEYWKRFDDLVAFREVINEITHSPLRVRVCVCACVYVFL